MQLPVRHFFAFIVLVGIAFTACKKSNHGSGNTSAGYVSATINGQVFTPTKVVAEHISGAAADSLNQIAHYEIWAYKFGGYDSTIVDFTFIDEAKTGQTYDNNSGGFGYFYFPKGFSANMWYSWQARQGAGNITISTLDTIKHTVSGTFFGTAYLDWATSGDSIFGYKWSVQRHLHRGEIDFLTFLKTGGPRWNRSFCLFLPPVAFQNGRNTIYEIVNQTVV